MNQTQWEHLLEKRGAFEKERDLPLLKELVSSFPWFSPAYLLLAKLLYEDRSIYAEKYIHLGAAYTGNRAVLHDFIFTPPQKAEQGETVTAEDVLPLISSPLSDSDEAIIEEEAVETDNIIPAVEEREAEEAWADHSNEIPEIEPQPEEPLAEASEASADVISVYIEEASTETSEDVGTPEEAAMEIPAPEEAEIAEAKQEEETETQEAFDVEPVAESEFIQEDEAATDFTVETEQAQESENLQDEVAENAIAAIETSEQQLQNIGEEVQPVSEEIEIPEDNQQSKADYQEEHQQPVPDEQPKETQKSPLEYTPQPLSSYDYFTSLGLNNEVPEVRVFHHEQQSAQTEAPSSKKKTSFGDWLNKLSTEKQTTTIAETAAPQPSAETAAPSPAPPQPEEKKSQPSASELIDRFISNEPRMRPKPAKFYRAEDMASKSVEEDPNLVTETLARIYATQGMKTKAIEVYRKLIAKNPSKSTYFADRIDELEKV